MREGERKCVCVCVCGSEREREMGGGERERHRSEKELSMGRRKLGSFTRKFPRTKGHAFLD